MHWGLNGSIGWRGGGVEGKLSWGKGGLQGKKQGGGIEFECRQRLNVMRGGAHSL